MSDQTTPTSKIAGAAHTQVIGSRRERILALLRGEPLALFELAERMGVGDHQISGVLTALNSDGFIERSGERRIKPTTQCPADVWRIASPLAEPGKAEELADRLGYPASLVYDNDLWDRQPLLPSEGYPGVPYARRADTGGLRLERRFEFIECPGCGRPVRQTDPKTRSCTCGRRECGQVWRTGLAAEPGQPPSLVLVRV